MLTGSRIGKPQVAISR